MVGDVESYPAFLPGCVDAKILNRHGNQLQASLTLAAGKIHQSFTTENTVVPGRRIEIHLLDGPFKYLDGYWQFEPQEDGGCCISLQMDFEFKNRLVKLALDGVFGKIVNTLIETFTRRAEQIYGDG